MELLIKTFTVDKERTSATNFDGPKSDELMRQYWESKPALRPDPYFSVVSTVLTEQSGESTTLSIFTTHQIDS